MKLTHKEILSRSMGLIHQACLRTDLCVKPAHEQIMIH